ncbi:large ribosomal subunit protein uL29m isoform X2 [Antennarius striatus]|uniref:large ribosomal subunit protein uL29m isoform X2 n=1 Tax=Antennarius striatus TaxID=241820 RepID=UPI0035AFF9D4
MAASSSVGRVLTLCKQFVNVVKIPSAVNTRNLAINGQFKFRPDSSVGQCRGLYTTISRRGLEEFFDNPENWGESAVKSGAPWTAKQLRIKSNEDLHKLWYVLLKEKNLLLTLQQEAIRQNVMMPSPERLTKVTQSMRRLDSVVTEREIALRLLQTGREKGRPGAWRRNIFGFTSWYRFREYAIPWYMNRIYKRKTFFTPKFVEPFIRLRREKRLRENTRKATLEKQTRDRLKEKFPHMKVPASSGQL